VPPFGSHAWITPFEEHNGIGARERSSKADSESLRPDDRSATLNPFVQVKEKSKDQIMRKNLHRLAVLTTLTLTSMSMSALPPIYMDFDGLKGEATSKDKHNTTIEIASWSLGASNSASGNRVQGNLIGTDATGCATGPFKFTLRGAAAESVKKLCQSRVPVGNVTVDIDGVKHRFENASFASCQSGDGAVPTDQFSLNYAKCTYHRGGVRVAAGDVNGDGATQANARLIGLRSIPIAVQLESLELNPDGKSGTMSLTKVGAGTLSLGSTNAAGPQLVLELTNGTRWTFMEYKLENVIVSSATARSTRPVDQFSINFTKVEGPAAGYTRR
jgi:type VI protein secretion system component Hcp